MERPLLNAKNVPSQALLLILFAQNVWIIIITQIRIKYVSTVAQQYKNVSYAIKRAPTARYNALCAQALTLFKTILAYYVHRSYPIVNIALHR